MSKGFDNTEELKQVIVAFLLVCVVPVHDILNLFLRTSCKHMCGIIQLFNVTHGCNHGKLIHSTYSMNILKHS